MDSVWIEDEKEKSGIENEEEEEAAFIKGSSASINSPPTGSDWKSLQPYKSIKAAITSLPNSKLTRRTRWNQQVFLRRIGFIIITNPSNSKRDQKQPSEVDLENKMKRKNRFTNRSTEKFVQKILKNWISILENTCAFDKPFFSSLLSDHSKTNSKIRNWKTDD